jgi:hypothetical protein
MAATVASRALAFLAVVLAAACSPPTDPIVIQEGTITIENRSSREWRDVRITVNDHFFGGVPSLAAGGRVNAPLSQFQTGFGQKYDRWRMSVKKIEVTATADNGEAVKLEWKPLHRP